MGHDIPSDLQQLFTQRYLEGLTPWDSGISPPELLAVLAIPAMLPPGWALDVGCGTGTNSLTMAKHGWHVLGVDFAAPAIAQATAKAAQEASAIAQAGGEARFRQADVTTLPPPPSDEQATLMLDIGCLNGIPPERRPAYAQVMAEQAVPGALFLLYAHLPQSDGSGLMGCLPDEIDALFRAHFVVEQRVMGDAPQGGASMWNWLRRRL